MDEQKARHKWSDYLMQGRVALEIAARNAAAGIDGETSLTMLVAKNRKKAFDAYLDTLNG